MVTVEERLKAAKLFEQQGHAKHSYTFKGAANSFSKGEKDLYREVGQLRDLDREDVLDEWEKNQVKRLFRSEFDKDKTGIPSKDELKRLF
jgi:hypothetical protein